MAKEAYKVKNGGGNSNPWNAISPRTRSFGVYRGEAIARRAKSLSERYAPNWKQSGAQEVRNVTRIVNAVQRMRRFGGRYS